MTNLLQMAREISEPWKPRLAAEANGFELKVVRLHGEFPWHQHELEDELFYCLEGSFRIELEQRDAVTLSSGEVFVVPAGVRHRPVADEPALAALFERGETKQYGD